MLLFWFTLPFTTGGEQLVGPCPLAIELTEPALSAEGGLPMPSQLCPLIFGLAAVVDAVADTPVTNCPWLSTLIIADGVGCLLFSPVADDDDGDE